MVRFSLIVPVMDNLSRFEETLASVLRYRCEAAQIIVAHNGVYDDPYGLGKEVDFVGTDSDDDAPSELISRMNAAIKIARGEIVVCLRPGIQLTENWERPVVAAFADPAVGSVAPAIVNRLSDQRLVTTGVAGDWAFNRKLVGVGQRINSRRLSKLKPLGPSSWAAFYRRSLLTALGECDAQLDTHYFDLDLALSFQALNFDCVFCPECTVTIDDPTSIANEARLARGLTSVLNQKGGAVTLRLTPAEMGTVRIQLQLSGSSVSAQFHTETSGARSLLQQQMSTLRTALEAQGLQVDRLTVQTSNSSTGSQFGQSRGDGSANDGHTRGQYSQSQSQGRNTRDGSGDEFERMFQSHDTGAATALFGKG